MEIRRQASDERPRADITRPNRDAIQRTTAESLKRIAERPEEEPKTDPTATGGASGNPGSVKRGGGRTGTDADSAAARRSSGARAGKSSAREGFAAAQERPSRSARRPIRTQVSISGTYEVLSCALFTPLPLKGMHARNGYRSTRPVGALRAS